MNACVQYCKENHYQFLTVKTLDESAVYEPYNGTRAFYKKEGFYPLEVFTKTLYTIIDGEIVYQADSGR